MKDINKTALNTYHSKSIIEHEEVLVDNMETTKIDGIYVIERRYKVERRKRKSRVIFERRTSSDRRDTHQVDIKI